MSLTARDFKAEGYRSLMRVACPFSDLDVFVGAPLAGVVGHSFARLEAMGAFDDESD